MVTIPNQNKTFLQTNRSNLLGNIWSSRNLDLQSNVGAIRLSPRMKVISTTSDLANMDSYPVGFKYFDTGLWTIAGASGAGRVFSNTSGGGSNTQNAFSLDSSSGAATDFDSTLSDLEVIWGRLYVTSKDELLRKASNGSNTGAWTGSLMSLNTGTTHQLCYFKKYNRLYVVDAGTQIKSINYADSAQTSAGDYFINITDADTASYTITSIEATSNYIWIGTLDASNKAGRGKILQWDGKSAQVTNEYMVDAQGVLSIVIDGDIPYAIDSNGTYLKYTGGSFEEVGRLPIKKDLLVNATSTVNNRFIHPNGLVVTRDRTFLALVGNRIARDSGNSITSDERNSSGIYEFDGKGSCIHQNSPTYTNTTTVTDYGQNRILTPGGLANTNLYVTTSGYYGSLIFGATYYTNASSTTSGIFVDDTLNTVERYGYLTTPWILGSGVRDYWKAIHVKYRKLLNSTDRIYLKYRTTEGTATDISITWVNTTSFTTTTNVSALVGYEVEFLQGTGSGKCVHISSVTGSGTYTVTIDEAVTGVTTGTATARVQNWTKFHVVQDQTTESFKLDWNKATERIQFKLCMQFTGDNEVFELGISNKVNVPSN